MSEPRGDWCAHRRAFATIERPLMHWMAPRSRYWNPCRQCERGEREAWIEGVCRRLQAALFDALRGREIIWRPLRDERWELEYRLGILRQLRDGTGDREELEGQLEALRNARRMLRGRRDN